MLVKTQNEKLKASVLAECTLVFVWSDFQRWLVQSQCVRGKKKKKISNQYFIHEGFFTKEMICCWPEFS